MQRICVLFLFAIIWHKSLQQGGGRNDGEPDYDGDGFDVRVPINNTIEKRSPTYLMLMPEDMENLEELSRIETRSGGGNDIVEVPDSVWDAERNQSNANPVLRQSSPPSSGCLNIKLVYNRGWVQSAGGGSTTLAAQRAQQALTEAQNIFNTKFSSSNRLGTNIQFTLVGGVPVYDTSGTYSATGTDLDSSAIRRHIDTSSHSTAHYAFLAGRTSGGAIGIAYLGTACFRNSGDQRYKTSITEWYNNLSDTAGVLAHEIGHGLGLLHDFGSTTLDKKYDSSGNLCTGINGVMDYGSRSRVNKWSGCSRDEFARWYRRVVNTYGSFCLTCGSTNPNPNPNPPTNPSTCNGNPRTDWRCCSSTNQCNVGGGDCDTDSDCSGSFTCGSNNCRRDFSPAGSNWHRYADCCIDATAAPNPAQCNGVPRTSWECCTPTNQCSLGEGDCDTDSDCSGTLRCGSNNCRRDHSGTGSNWSRGADCCIEDNTPPPTTQCNGVPRTNWNCCTSSNQCPVGGGDCDNDSHCSGALVCGNNNCRTDFSSSGSRWSSVADCCIDSSSVTPPPTQPTQPTAAPPTSGACGVKPAQIVGGSEVTPYSLPWQVALVSRGGNRPFCGGTLISERHVLTAAHCTSGPSDNPRFDIIVGEHDITSSSDGTRHRVCWYRDHPSYNSGTLRYDFSILRLTTPVTIGTRAAPACLPPISYNDNFLSGKTLTVSGWGVKSQGCTSNSCTTNTLLKVNVPGMTNSQCNNYYSGIHSSMLCAGRASGGIDSCQGDSGGPLTYSDGSKTYVVGVVSWGIGCAQRNRPGVYSRVTEVLGWINGELAQKTCS